MSFASVCEIQTPRGLPTILLQTAASRIILPAGCPLQSAVAPLHRVFLLSPAKAGGVRYEMLLREQARFDLAEKLRQGAASIGEVYSFISGLYFRGKMAYTETFGAAPPGIPRALVIVPGIGLVPSDTPVTIEQLRATANIPVDERNEAYRDALLRAARLLDEHAGPTCLYVLLGSIASGKYTAPLLEVFGERLVFPADFVGRGDMSRGGLMLRRAHSGIELSYIPVHGAVRHGARPPKLERLQRTGRGAPGPSGPGSPVVRDQK